MCQKSFYLTKLMFSGETVAHQIYRYPITQIREHVAQRGTLHN